MTPKRLLAIRKRMGLTQEEFAARIGVAANSVARWERGELGMRPATAARIQELALNTDLTKREHS